MHPVEFKLRRFLSRHPRVKRFASRIRRAATWVWESERAEENWDHSVSAVESARPQGWLDLEMIESEYVRPRISGDRERNFLQYFFDEHLDALPVSRVLSLGCGGGNLERAILYLGAAEKIDGLDSSPGSIELARRLAFEEGLAERLEYGVADLNRHELPSSTYDLVVAKHSLHHLENLEHVFAQVRRTLRPGGLLMFNEFVGPTRFQWTDDQLKLMNRLFSAVPQSIRDKVPVVEILRPSIEDMLATDPSESVRSAEILSVVATEFEILECKPYGGTLLHIVLAHLLPHLDLTDENHLAFLRFMMVFEGTLLEHGVIASDHAYVVARPRRESGSPGRAGNLSPDGR